MIVLGPPTFWPVFRALLWECRWGISKMAFILVALIGFGVLAEWAEQNGYMPAGRQSTAPQECICP